MGGRTLHSNTYAEWELTFLNGMTSPLPLSLPNQSTCTARLKTSTLYNIEQHTFADCFFARWFNAGFDILIVGSRVHSFFLKNAIPSKYMGLLMLTCHLGNGTGY